MSAGFINYLAAKKTVDDQALNRVVLAHLTEAMSRLEPPLRVLEVAAGIGTMLERLLEWQILQNVNYTAIDLSAEYIQAAVLRLPSWAVKQGFQVEQTGATQFKLCRGEHHVTVQFEAIDVFEFVRREQGQPSWNLLIAHAFWDLVDVSALLPPLLGLLKPHGLYYFTVNFDGETILLPTMTLDREIISQYHQAMNEQHVQNKAGAGTQTGRYLFQHLAEAGAEIINVGSSDWVVFPTEGRYPNKQADFLHHIINSIATMLQDYLMPDLQTWLEQRHAQIEAGQLVYIAHQLDFVGRAKQAA